MGNKDLIINLKKRIEMQVEDCILVSKLKIKSKKTFEKGFIRGYISSINYMATILKQNNIISLEEFLELNELIAENLDRIKECE